MEQNTSGVNPLQRVRDEHTQASAAKAAAYVVELDRLKALCGEQLQIIDMIVAWARQHNLGYDSHGSRCFDMAQMNIPDEKGYVDLLTKYTLRLVLDQGPMSWDYVSGTASSCGWHQLLEREYGFWVVLARVSPEVFFRSLQETAKREQVPMPV